MQQKHVIIIRGRMTVLGLLYKRRQKQVKSHIIKSSVADPDPVESGLFGSPGSGSGKIPDPDPLSTKGPLQFKFSRHKILILLNLIFLLLPISVAEG